MSSRAPGAALRHHQTHRVLLRRVQPGRPRPVDGIIVPASRPAPHVSTSATLADQLGAQLVVLCSGAARPDEVGELAAERPGLRWAAIEIPAGYEHILLRTATARIRDARVPRLGDLSVKRNVGLLLARMLDWRSVLFLDDDIWGVDAATARRAASGLNVASMVGLTVRDFPDNSVVCHANRLAGRRQDVLVGGAALLVDPFRRPAFCPEIYNEDWFLMFGGLAAGEVACAGEARQLGFDPFAEPGRATAEEFGDVLAEGLLGALHGTRAWEPLVSPAYWQRFLRLRRDFIARAAEGIARRPWAGSGAAALAGLDAAEQRRVAISAVSCAAYVRTWRSDLAAWAHRLDNLTRASSLERAARDLGLHLSACSPTVRSSRKGPTVINDDYFEHPTARVAPTAQINSPYRPLGKGQRERLGRRTSIGARCDVGHFCVVGEEVELGAGTILDSYTLVEGGVTIGRNVLVTHRASIHTRARIGDGCVIGALVCDRSTVGERCRVFGDLIHRQQDPTMRWDAPEAQEPSPVLEDRVFVGWGATIVGGVKVGAGSYVCAGATVTKDVPPGMIVTGTNQHVSPDLWKGDLGKSPFFRSEAGSAVPQPDVPARAV